MAAKLARHIGGGLKLRAVMLDVRVLTRHPAERAPPPTQPLQQRTAPAIRRPEDLLADGHISQMLLNELRDEMRARGLSILGSRDELEARLQHLLTRPPPKPAPAPTLAGPVAERDDPDVPLAELFAALSAAKPPEAPAASTADSLRSKYADKLLARGASGLLRNGGAASRSSAGGMPMADGGAVERERERAVRDHAEAQRGAQTDRGGFSFQPGGVHC